jgi:RTX calcium-binding nonapeptide repeat (4 copies)
MYRATKETLTGTNDVDNIYGLGKADTLNGLGGNDEISGNGGADTMNGGEGDDIMVGGAGEDKINTGNSTNETGGEDGFDFAHAQDGRADTVCVGTGDFFVFFDEFDTVRGPPNCSDPIFTPTATPAAGTGAAVTMGNIDASPQP